MPLDWSPLWLCLRYAGLATLFATAVALPLAWFLTQGRFPGNDWLDALGSLPLILPPAVFTYYLASAALRWPPRFSWHAAVALSAVYTLPLLLRMFRDGLRALDPGIANAARCLGAGEWRIFWMVTLPLAWRAILAAMLAGFMRAFADFAATVIAVNGAGAVWLLPVAAAALGALYAANRVRSGRVTA